MVYILETKMSKTTQLKNALMLVYGIGHQKALLICKKGGISYNCRVSSLTREQLNCVVSIAKLLNFPITNQLKKIRSLALKDLVLIGVRRGLRVMSGLPVRGQRTKTNAKSVRKFTKIYS